MKASTSAIVVSIGALIVTATAATAGAYDLTGTWEGKWSCSGFDGEKFKEVRQPSTLLISQAIDTIAADLDSGWVWNGRAIPDAKKPEKGELILIDCGTDNLPGPGDPSEIIRAKVKTKIGSDKASLSGLSIYEGTYDGFFEVGTCKYSYKRKDSVPPNVQPCP